MYYKQRSHDCDPTLHQTTTEAKYVLVKTSLTNGLRSPKEKYNDPPKGTCCCLELYDLVHVELGEEAPSGLVVSSLKYKISKREYKDVLNKTYIRSILLMLKFQGK